uniref:Extended-spectrum beta-lactamase n=1 Tax=Escherichia coli TaxID=562 RepID=A0A7I8HMM1_ECOLX|nr:extended-spectrum beta-lactamase [Escherichia coli]
MQRPPQCCTSQAYPNLLHQRVEIKKSHLVTYHPIAEKHVNGTMSLAQLTAAALQYSDNVAMNQLICSRWRPGYRHRVRPTAGRRNVPSRPYRADVQHRHSGRSACYHFTSGNGANSAESAAGSSIGRQPTGAVGHMDQRQYHRCIKHSGSVPASCVVGKKPGGGGFYLLPLFGW